MCSTLGATTRTVSHREHPAEPVQGADTTVSRTGDARARLAQSRGPSARPHGVAAPLGRTDALAGRQGAAPVCAEQRALYEAVCTHLDRRDRDDRRGIDLLHRVASGAALARAVQRSGWAPAPHHIAAVQSKGAPRDRPAFLHRILKCHRGLRRAHSW